MDLWYIFAAVRQHISLSLHFIILIRYCSTVFASENEIGIDLIETIRFSRMEIEIKSFDFRLKWSNLKRTQFWTHAVESDKSFKRISQKPPGKNDSPKFDPEWGINVWTPSLSLILQSNVL